MIGNYTYPRIQKLRNTTDHYGSIGWSKTSLPLFLFNISYGVLCVSSYIKTPISSLLGDIFENKY